MQRLAAGHYTKGTTVDTTCYCGAAAVAVTKRTLSSPTGQGIQGARIIDGTEVRCTSDDCGDHRFIRP